MKHLVAVVLLLLASMVVVTESIPLTGDASRKVRSRFRRREFVQEEVRKTMSSYMTSIKGEITDIVLEEMIDYYNGQSSKLRRLENEVVTMKNSSLPVGHVNTTLNQLVLGMSTQQRAFASNISSMENKISNLTEMIHNLLIGLQQKPVQHVRRLVSAKRNLDQDELPTDCDDVLRQTPTVASEGIFRIKPRGASDSFDVKCVFENGAGWSVIQRRVNGTVDFYRGWKDYRSGFGDVRSEFWLGNERIHQLTTQANYILRIDLLPWDAPIRVAEYGRFAVANETDDYKLHISDFRANVSTAGDSLSPAWDNADGAPFSTFDHDADNLFYDNCALTYHGAWWFTNCFQSHLNGAYVRSPLALQNTARNGLHWNTYALHHSMRETTMRVRREIVSKTR